MNANTKQENLNMDSPVYYWNCETQQIELWVEPKRTVVYDDGQIVIVPEGMRYEQQRTRGLLRCTK
jgi:hypothetical protein